jgi:L-lactate utilization protein LutC
MDYTQLASAEQIDRTMKSLDANGINAMLVQTGEEAKKKVLEMIPEHSEVMTMTSMTNEAIGLAKELNESGRYQTTRTKLMDKDTTPSEKRKLGGGPDYATGSVHALTEDGTLMIASNTGSQLGAYAYGAGNVIWVVGAQKIVKDMDEGMKRIYEHVLPLESERANKAYNITTGSNVSKLLIINREVAKGRATVVIVNEKLGF